MAVFQVLRFRVLSCDSRPLRLHADFGGAMRTRRSGFTGGQVTYGSRSPPSTVVGVALCTRAHDQRRLGVKLSQSRPNEAM